MYIEKSSHFLGFRRLNGCRKRSVLCDFSSTAVFSIKKETISAVVASHKVGKLFEMCEFIDFVAVVAHEGAAMKGVFALLFIKLFIEHLSIGLFFVVGFDVPFAVMTSPDFVDREAFLDEPSSRGAGHEGRAEHISCQG